MPHYKLVYFDIRGRAETIRMLFAVAGVPYDDYRIKSEDWLQLKPATPFGQVPILEVDGRRLAQSNAICRFLADKFGFMGRNPIEKAAIDGCCETITEIREHVMAAQTMKQPKEAKDKVTQGLMEVTLPQIYEKLEKCLKKNKDGDKYFYGDEITLADIHFFACCETVLRLNPKSFHDFPKLAALYDRVKNNNKIDKWLDERQDSEI
ncbi:hypothetical protein LSH36_365g04041 [Paralvinella palmiformis]|uniref:glutathione transferase n=1 Tax=Paralvinella palmiformis TaxID=53620 RepID=A0AAD9JEY6_9ANNE|nr:hypothetical protein LSH36_365g04041 [Paralvinella palmiformis]